MFSRDTYRVARLVHQLHGSPDERRRLQAVHLLRDLNHPMAIGELINSLEDPCREVREAAADTLGWFGVGEAAEPLAKTLQDPDPAIQARAARALGRIGGEESLLALLQNLKNENTHALHETVDALGQIRDSAAMVPLIYLFYEFDNPHLRRRIAIALSKMSDDESIDEVMTMLASEASEE
jgi:HEAT repeat protein